MERKTQQTEASVDAYLAAIADPQRREDCRALAAMMRTASGAEAKMWGTGIVGFDRYVYRLANGKDADMCLIGFASRAQNIALYIMPGFDICRPLLERLGPHKTAKACLYLKRLADVDLTVLQQLLDLAVREMRRKYPDPA